MASPTDSYGKWLGDLLLATVVGILVLNTFYFFLVSGALDPISLALVDAGIFAVVATLLVIGGLFRSKKDPAKRRGPRLFAAVCGLLAACGYAFEVYSRFHTQGVFSWLLSVSSFCYLIFSCTMFFSWHKARKLNV